MNFDNIAGLQAAALMMVLLAGVVLGLLLGFASSSAYWAAREHSLRQTCRRLSAQLLDRARTPINLAGDERDYRQVPEQV